MDKPKLRIKIMECGCCNGIKWGGDSPVECRDCGGKGFVYITEHDRIIDYPGGPFRGSCPGTFEELERQGIEDYEWQPTKSKDELYNDIADLTYDLMIAIGTLEYYSNQPNGDYAKRTIAYLNNTLEVDSTDEFLEQHMIALEHPDGTKDYKSKGEPGIIDCFLSGRGREHER